MTPSYTMTTATLQITEDQWNGAAWCCHNSLLINTDINLVPRVLPMGKTLVGASQATLQK